MSSVKGKLLCFIQISEGIKSPCARTGWLFTGGDVVFKLGRKGHSEHATEGLHLGGDHGIGATATGHHHMTV
jgi:hypothetical protein